MTRSTAATQLAVRVKLGKKRHFVHHFWMFSDHSPPTTSTMILRSMNPWMRMAVVHAYSQPLLLTTAASITITTWVAIHHSLLHLKLPHLHNCTANVSLMLHLVHLLGWQLPLVIIPKRVTVEMAPPVVQVVAPVMTTKAHQTLTHQVHGVYHRTCPS